MSQSSILYNTKYVYLSVYNYSQTVNSTDMKSTEHCLKTISRLTLLFRTVKLNINFNSINLINTLSSPWNVR